MTDHNQTPEAEAAPDTRIAELEAKIAELTAEAELRKTGDSVAGDEVTIEPPSRKTRWGASHRDFTLSEVEEACMRLRLAGACDVTHIRLGYRKISADVTDPLPPSAAEKRERAERAAAALAKAEADRRAARVRRALVIIPAMVFGPAVAILLWWALTGLYGALVGLVA